jgi:hypothetical protein
MPLVLKSTKKAREKGELLSVLIARNWPYVLHIVVFILIIVAQQPGVSNGLPWII